MPLSREHFRHLIPHAGAMCLIDRIESWDASTIRCSASSHRRSDHPLAEDGILHAVCGIEYAAQAAALHGGLLAEQAGGRAAPGWLAAVRGVRLHRKRLDDLGDDLTITAESDWADAGGLIYEFEITAGDIRVLDGRLTVMLRPEVSR